MATLRPGFRESDAFSMDVTVLLDGPSAMIEESRKMGVCLDFGAWPGLTALEVVCAVVQAKTIGEVIRKVEALRPKCAPVDEKVDLAMRDADMKAAAVAWKINYIASEPVLDFVAKKLQSYASQWDKHSMYAPLVALVQSSGWGKSRLMCQLWRRDFYVFYLSCMAEKQTGFPRRTGKLADIMQSPESNEAHFVVLVLSIIRVLNKHAGNMTCEQWIQAQEEGNEIQEEVLSVYNEKLPEIKQLKESKADPDLEGCLQQELDQCNVKLLLCIDEAGELGDNFVMFRRSLRNIPSGKQFLTVVLGTDRKVADLAAAAEDDPSARVRWMNPYHVYHPLYLIGVCDIFACCSEAETSTAPADVIRYGRPLWAAYYDSVPEVGKLRATIRFAQIKLLGRNIDTEGVGWVTRDITVAVFASLVGVEVVAWGGLPQELVAKHMRTIVNISEDRRRVYTAAAVEPVLAAAAAKLLHAKNDAFLGEFLTKLMEVFVDGLVLEGVRGEVVARIIIMLAMHECTAKGNYIQPVTLATFLKTMIGESRMEEMKMSCGNLEEYSLFFNSFTPISVEIFKELADAAYARCTALTARRNETVIDFALPLHLGFGDFVRSRPMQDTVVVELQNPQPKGVVVAGQVKNWRNEMSMNTEIRKLQDDDRLSTPVQLILQIGYRGVPKIEIKGETVVFYGIGCFEHLKFEKMRELQVIEKLMLLSRTCEDILKNATKEEQAVLKDMIPIGLASKSFLEDMDMDMDDEPQVPMKWSRTSSRTSRGRRKDVQMGEADAT